MAFDGPSQAAIAALDRHPEGLCRTYEFPAAGVANVGREPDSQGWFEINEIPSIDG